MASQWCNILSGWISRQTLKLTEVTASDKLESFRAVKKVLKDHIALGNAQFPNGTNGHGIGSYLNVHEGIKSISVIVEVPRML
ncbi:probable Xaa-Pro aminopeptidase P isoform X3 [Ziziphus jujuba]|uniref:Probable Xaa-Pro aminopeptidase P isoform X3 n=1 Tax=Ziziphus jujuba TaxID=326968 RepID=A0ABM3ZYU7_ZIZJJ|nr:probable Xaa-Pro aminopeptidase P isoform X3 [Ziziphus jujuba]